MGGKWRRMIRRRKRNSWRRMKRLTMKIVDIRRGDFETYGRMTKRT